ncbi:hypothetical protein [Knoellia flava]|uniref:PPE family domain-containing protein n=1 Tax=Knoellia flava TaxID=913969 RepID=A0A8H9FTH6_9MICO|nr:hypothetical protein [Knoellia flava]GGB70424.1 hypothetical protein GCM10011314_07180 [Knoellia flava]
MVLIADGGGGGPTLNPKAKHYERQLFKVFSSSTSTIFLTQEDWRAAKTKLDDLAKDVQQVRTELQAPSDGGKGWQGPAAEAALSSLEKLSTTLDGHASKIGDVDTSLGQVYQAISDAKAAWYSDVASISTYVDPADHTRLPAPYLPTAENREKYSVPDAEAAAAAEDALWEQRNQAAKKVLDQLGADTRTATGTMPIDTTQDKQAPYSPSGPGPSTNYPSGTSTPSTSGGYHVGAYGQPVYEIHPTGPGGDPGGEEIPIPNPEEPEEITIGDPEGPDPDPDHELDPISSDGDVTGSTGLTGPPATGASSAAGGGGGGVGVGSVAAGGVGAGAAGIGGILSGRAGGMFGSRGGAGVVPAAGAQGRATGAGGRGGTGSSAVRSGGVGGRGAQVIPGGGQGRAATSARGSAVKGASGSGRYGVPKLDGRSNGVVPGSGQAAKGGARSGAAGRNGPAARGGSGAGRGGGVAGTSGTAGSRGSRGERRGAHETDNLTHEDEETWFEGTEESSPQVWE